ncbi:cap binding protein [Aulographum hederae CBS 113979]|uniref:Cap binding protein n=1 Tax=Aulographum hederae CBS 113979 TaxID=1176131 RepID=A0A6G1GYE6_9PEZI|nr:cap binding protein [Aulographum hederae CBS 113979]
MDKSQQQNGGGGGGRDRRANDGGGRHNNRKRRHRDDDDDDRPTRRRYEEPLAVKLRKQVLAIGEEGLTQECADLGSLLASNWTEKEVQRDVVELVVQLVCEQPFKIPFVAALVLHANDANPEVAAEILKRAGKKAQSLLDQGDLRGFKLVLRLLALLQGVFEGDGIFGLLDDLFNRAVDLQAASSNDAIGIELGKIILLTIPYLFASTATDLVSRVQELLERTEIIATAPHPQEAYVEPYTGEDDEKPFGFESLIGLLQKELMRESENGWAFSCLARPYTPPDANDASPSKHEFPNIVIPSLVNTGAKEMFPETFFTIYSDQEFESAPRTEDIACMLLRDACIDTINVLDFNRISAAKILIDIDLYWAPNTFAPRGTPFDKLKEFEDDKSTWKPEDVIIDAVFSQIFLLPAPDHKLIYYHSVITEACKAAPGAIAPTLGRAIRFLFKHVDRMDMELAYRFMDWFAHHLSNFDFRWKWSEWLESVDSIDLDPKKSFIIGALDKEIRLSFAKRIRDTLPEPYHILIPIEKEKDTPEFKYESDQTPYAVEGRKIHALLRKKADESEIEEIISSIHTQASDLGVEDPLVPSTDAYVTAICYIGSKSLSHVLSCIERCKERLLAIGEKSDKARLQIIQSVVEYWHWQPGTAVNIVDKLLNYTIVTPDSVVQWALGAEGLGDGRVLAQTWRFEMVAGTVGKVTNRVRQIATARIQAKKQRLEQEQVDHVAQVMTAERESMRALFKSIADAVGPVAAGASDGLIEAEGAALDPDEVDFVKAWGARWERTFMRKSVVEECIVGDMAVLAKLTALEAEEVEEAPNGDDAAEADENANGNGNGELDTDVMAEVDIV